MDNQTLVERWWGTLVSIFVIVFMSWFIISEFEGFASFVEFIGKGIAAVPGSIAVVADYYASVPFGQFLGSAVVGGLFGAATTSFVLLSNEGRLDNIRRSVVAGSLVGGLAGAVGAQVLAFPMQHCTYSGEATSVAMLIGVGITVASTLFVLVPLWTWMSRRGRRIDAGTSGYFQGWMLPIVLLAPTLISLVVFLYYPAMQVATLSLNAQRFRQTRFVCLNNYVEVFNDVIYQNSFLITLLITVAIVLFSMSLGLTTAVLASQKVRGASVYRTLLIWPYALSPVVTGTIFLAMFRQGRSGLVNYGLYEVLGTTANWFSNPSLAPWVIIFASVWNALGFNILFYIAGLQNVPKDLLEAAQIDGANRVQRFIRVTFPLLSPYTFFLLVTNVTFSFYGIYGAVDTLTQGGPPLGIGGQEGGATNVLIYKLYEDAFAPGAQVGGAAAQSIIMFILVAGMTLLQFRYVERRVTYGE